METILQEDQEKLEKILNNYDHPFFVDKDDYLSKLTFNPDIVTNDSNFYVYSGDPKEYDHDNDFDFITTYPVESYCCKPDTLDPNAKVYLISKIGEIITDNTKFCLVKDFPL